MIRRHAVVPLGVAVALDRLVTMQAFHLESNPLVNGLGASLWGLLSAVLVIAAFGLWYRMELWRSKVTLFCVVSVTVLTLFAVLVNLSVLVSG